MQHRNPGEACGDELSRSLYECTAVKVEVFVHLGDLEVIVLLLPGSMLLFNITHSGF